jgi:hypothetical protein|tara:strand:- start:5 stop:265 length:261 start_codon:yes stop_codon:yes gene_type:complete
MKFEVVQGGIWRADIDTNDFDDMLQFVRQEVMCALEEKTKFDEEEIDLILELLLEDEDWEKAISIMKSCGFEFRVDVSKVDLETLI